VQAQDGCALLRGHPTVPVSHEHLHSWGWRSRPASAWLARRSLAPGSSCRDPLARANAPGEHAATPRATHCLAHGGLAVLCSIRCFIGRHLRVARRLHLGARRRWRCRSGRILCRGSVRYVPSVQCRPFTPTRLSCPVRRDAPRRLRVHAVPSPVRHAPPRRRAPTAARSHRGARPAQDQHPLAPTTSTESTIHAPLRSERLDARHDPPHARSRRASTRLPRRLGWLDPGLHLLQTDALRRHDVEHHDHRAPRPGHKPSTGAHRFSVSPPGPPRPTRIRSAA